MSDLALDASVLVRLAISEPDSDRASDLVTEVLERGDRIVAVDFALIESVNVIFKYARRQLITKDQAREIAELLLGIDVIYRPTRTHLLDALDLACEHGLAVYDTLFVVLLEREQLRGVTADVKLHVVAQSVGAGCDLL